MLRCCGVGYGGVVGTVVSGLTWVPLIPLAAIAASFLKRSCNVREWARSRRSSLRLLTRPKLLAEEVRAGSSDMMTRCIWYRILHGTPSGREMCIEGRGVGRVLVVLKRGFERDESLETGRQT